jgi:hypothetical protein
MEKTRDFLHTKQDPVKVWAIRISPLSILTFSTVVSTVGFIIYLIFSMSVVRGDATTLPSLSGMIAYSRGTTISFTLMVFVHGYGVMAYLVIASEYVGLQSLHFKVIATCSLVYWMSLILVSYLPITTDENPHNIFAVTSFTFATLTVYLHKHSFVISRWPYIDFSVSEKYLIASEIVMISTVSVMGILFWQYDVMVAEYIFLALIIIDKFFKVTILEKSGLMKLGGSFIEYTYFSPPNHAYNQVPNTNTP